VVCRRRHNAIEKTYVRLRRRLGGIDVPVSRKLESLVAGNTKLKKILADQMLVIAGLKELSGKMSIPLERRRALEALSSLGTLVRAACRYWD
jgi:putative transposase